MHRTPILLTLLAVACSSGSVGTPGPKGDTGPAGPQGPAGKSFIWVDATGTVVGPSMVATSWYVISGATRIPTTSGEKAAYVDPATGLVWSAQGLLLPPGGTGEAWWQAQGIFGSDSTLYDTAGNITSLGQPIYASGGGCHIAFYPVPTEPRLTFSYYDGSVWRFAAVKDSGVTGSSTAGLFRDAGCTSTFQFGPITLVAVGDANVAWNLTPPTVSFVQPFHREYR